MTKYNLYVTIIFVLVLCIFGCAENSKDQAPLPSQTLDTSNNQLDVSNMLRYVAAEGPASSAEEQFGPNGVRAQGSSARYNTLNVDCIAATFYDYDDSYSTKWNYILVCDNNDKWDATNRFSCQVFKVDADDTLADSTQTTDDATVYYDTYIKDPDACDLLVVKEYLWSCIYDADSGYIYVHRWHITDSDGSVGTCQRQSSIYEIDYGSGKNVTALFIIPIIESQDGSILFWHLLVCDSGDEKIYIYRSENNDVVDFTLDDFGSAYIPIEVCAIRWDNSADYFNVYAAIKHKTNPNFDSIYCWHWNGFNYNTYSHAYNSGGTSPIYFPRIMSCDVAKVGVIGEVTAIQNQHMSGSVAILMHDNAKITTKYRVKGGKFGQSSTTYYRFTEDDDNANWGDGEILIDSFAACYQYRSSAHKMLFVTGDRNPDMKASNYSGDNIRVYEEDT